jgi:hypothetical protein
VVAAAGSVAVVSAAAVSVAVVGVAAEGGVAVTATTVTAADAIGATAGADTSARIIDCSSVGAATTHDPNRNIRKHQVRRSGRRTCFVFGDRFGDCFWRLSAEPEAFAVDHRQLLQST